MKELSNIGEFHLPPEELIKINNELINRLLIEFHYLQNEVIEIRRILDNESVPSGRRTRRIEY